MAERAADFRLAPGSEPDRQDRLPPPVLVGLGQTVKLVYVRGDWSAQGKRRH